MDTYGKRLKAAMDHAHLTRADLARALECSVQAVGQAVTDKTSGFSLERHLKAAAACRVNQNWLFTGDGDMLDLSAGGSVDGASPLAQQLALYFDDMLPSGRQLRTVAFNAACNAIADAKHLHAAPQSAAPLVSQNREKQS